MVLLKYSKICGHSVMERKLPYYNSLTSPSSYIACSESDLKFTPYCTRVKPKKIWDLFSICDLCESRLFLSRRCNKQQVICWERKCIKAVLSPNWDYSSNCYWHSLNSFYFTWQILIPTSHWGTKHDSVLEIGQKREELKHLEMTTDTLPMPWQTPTLAIRRQVLWKI